MVWEEEEAELRYGRWLLGLHISSFLGGKMITQELSLEEYVGRGAHLHQGIAGQGLWKHSEGLVSRRA